MSYYAFTKFHDGYCALRKDTTQYDCMGENETYPTGICRLDYLYSDNYNSYREQVFVLEDEYLKIESTKKHDNYQEYGFERTLSPELAQVFDVNLPNGAKTTIDFTFKPAVKSYLESNFSGKLIKKIGYEFYLSGYPDDTAPCIILFNQRGSDLIPIDACRILAIPGYDALYWRTFPFTDEIDSDLYLFKDFTKWGQQGQYPIISHGYYASSYFRGFHFKFSDPTVTTGRFWQNYIKTAEEADDTIVGETDVQLEQEYVFDGYVSSVGETEFINHGTDEPWLNPHTRDYSTLTSVEYLGVPCWRLSDDHNFRTLSGPYQIPYSLEQGAFALSFHICMPSSGMSSEIMGNTHGIARDNGGFSLRRDTSYLYFERRASTPTGGITASVYIGDVFNAFTHVEISVDENNIFRCFINGVKKGEVGGFTDMPLRNSGYGVYVGRTCNFESIGSTYFYLASLKLARNIALINKADFTPPAIGQ